MIRVAVASRSFSKHPILRAELEARYPGSSFNERGKSLAGAELVSFLRGHSAAILALERVDEALLAQLPELTIISKFGVGLDSIDLDALERRGVRLAWSGGTNRRSVSELALALTLSLLRGLPEASARARRGEWTQGKGACLSSKTVGLLGCGNVGKDFALLLAPFGCRILCHDERPDAAFNSAHGVRAVGLEALLRESDVVSVHLPLTAATRGILNAERLAWMKPGAFLVNTARGGLVDEPALKAALASGRLAGAAFDAFAEEPPRDRALLELPNLLPTPHIGGSTEEATLAMGRAAIEGLARPRPAGDFR